MKRMLILIFICQSVAAFPQDSMYVEQKIPDSSSRRFPFLINAVVPWRNYFAGGQFLFEKWVRGSVVTANNEPFADSHYFLNFNKVTRNLLLTNDFKQIVEIDNREFKSFSLIDGEDTYRFEHVYLLHDHRFFQVLVKTEKYSLYKYIATHFRRTEMTRNPGEFEDTYFYYVVFPGGKTFKEIAFRKKNILKNFAADLEKVDAYFALHEHEPVDEHLLIALSAI